jgi:hypothetical protein
VSIWERLSWQESVGYERRGRKLQFPVEKTGNRKDGGDVGDSVMKRSSAVLHINDGYMVVDLEYQDRCIHFLWLP